MSNGERRKHKVIRLLIDLIMALIFTLLAAAAIWIGWKFYADKPADLPNISNVKDRVLETKAVNLTKAQIYDLKHFHNLDDIVSKGIQSESTCITCHGDYPHSQANNDRRGFLNAHAWFITCEVCHMPPKYREGIEFRWLDNITGEVLTELEGYAGVYGAMIVPVKFDEDGTMTRMDGTIDEFLSQEYLKNKDKLSETERKTLLDTLHETTTIHEAISFKSDKLCDECHTENGLLPFRDLLYSDRYAKHLESLDMVAMIKSYKEFHLPQFDRERASPAPESETQQAPGQ